uniref:Uncharacterized protein n=1 Tax=Panagrolaimus sp. JU765 TaxID=591449 RepID=A0AC34PUP5_9BILA
MNLLGVEQNNSSKPSLFSSTWSVQVQHQTEVNDSLCHECKSEHSVIEFNPKTAPINSRNALSQCELNLSVAKLHFKRAATCPSFIIENSGQSLEDIKYPLVISKEIYSQQSQQNASISRHQKNRNIYEWLQKVSIEPLSETCSISTMNDPTCILNKTSK